MSYDYSRIRRMMTIFKVKTEFDEQFVSIFAVENNLKLT